MLDYLWTTGKIMVAGRSGIQKLWDLSERCLPDWTPREKLSEKEVVRRAAQKALRALGVGTPQHINQHFTRKRYPHLKETLHALLAEGLIEKVHVEDDKAEWFIHTEDVPLLDRIEADEFAFERTTLLSPFDNLICDRARTAKLFNFDFRVEIYTPQHKRKFGYYVLPILHGDRLIGRIDPKMDREHGRLHIHAVHAETDAPLNRTTARVDPRRDRGPGHLPRRDARFTTRISCRPAGSANLNNLNSEIRMAARLGQGLRLHSASGGTPSLPAQRALRALLNRKSACR